MCPLLSDVLAFPTELVDPDGGQMGGSYFNRTDVKKAMHAPLDSNWAVCSLEPVYVGGSSGPQSEGDTSADPIQKVLPQVIEATNRVLVGNGDFDMVIITNGTLMAIQVSPKSLMKRCLPYHIVYASHHGVFEPQTFPRPFTIKHLHKHILKHITQPKFSFPADSH